jgi:hypothetical protein
LRALLLWLAVGAESMSEDPARLTSYAAEYDRWRPRLT